MKKNLLAIGVLAVAALTMTGCAPGTGSTTKQVTSDDVTLNVWSWRPEDVAQYKKIFAVYEKAHPGVTVNFQAFVATAYPQILTTGLTGSSNGPDIVQQQAYGKIQPYIKGGNLVELDGKVPGLANIDPAALAGAMGHTDGKVYGVPFATQTIQMFYNKDIFAKLNLSVPKTWQDFLSVNQKLKDANIVPMSVGAKDTFLLPLISEAFMSSVYGGRTFEKALLDGSTTFEDPAYVKAIATFKSLQKYMPDNLVGVSYTDSQALFFSGGAGMYPGGSFELGFFQTQNPNLKLGVFPVPPAPGSLSKVALTPGYADGSWALNKASTHQKAALELLNWMASKEFGQMFANDLSQISPIKGVKFNNPLLKEMAGNFARNGAPYLLLADFRWGTPSGTDVTAPGLQKLFLGSTDPAQLATSLQQGISTWFSPKK